MDLKDHTPQTTYVKAQPAAAPGEYVQVRTAKRKRRRTLTWVIFGIAGVAIGAVWAAGFATSQSTSNDAASTAPFIANTPNPQIASKFAGVVSSQTPLALDFTGTWGNVPFTTIFEIDFGANAETATGTYFAEVLLTDPLPSGYTTLQLEFVIDNVDCDVVTGAGSWTQDAISVMPIETQDARAVFTGLAGGSKHCIGVRADTKADDPAAHYIRRPANGTVTPPNLFLNVAQSA